MKCWLEGILYQGGVNSYYRGREKPGSSVESRGAGFIGEAH